MRHAVDAVILVLTLFTICGLLSPVEATQLSVSISPSEAVLIVGQSQLFTSTVTGGTSPYSYQWYLDDVLVSGATNAMWTFSPTTADSYTVYVVVTDSHPSPKSAQSNTALVTVNSALSVLISPSSVVLDVGQSRLFTSSVSGGTSPYTYQWYLNGAPVSGATSATWTFTPASSGSYTVYQKVTDAVSAVATSNTATVTVNGALSVTISPTSVALNVGQSQLFTSTVSGGTGPYSYQWYLDGSAVSGATSATWTYTLSASWSHTVYAKVTDSVSMQVTSNTATVTVNSALSVSISPSSVVLDVGQSRLFTSSVSGGTSPYTYQWYLNSAPASGATSSAWTFTPSSAGPYTVYLKVTDNVAVQATSNTAPVTVNSALSVSISPASVVMDVGQSQLFTSSVSGGTSPCSYRWYLNSTSVSGGTSATWTFTPSSSGSYNVYVRVTDNAGSGATSNIASVTVNPALSPPVAQFTESANETYTDILIQFDASLSYDPDGTIISYYWDFGDGKNTTGEVASHSYAEDGNYTVILTVTDDDGLAGAHQDAVLVQDRAPIASFTVSSTTVYTDETITFNATSSYDPDGTILSYFWDFGDGTNATGMVASHAYAHDGVYTVSLTVTDDDNNTDSTASTENILNRGTADQPPIAIFTVSAQNAYTGDSVVFNASGSYDPDGTITSYLWEFGDNFTASGDVVNHAYIENGNFLVNLTVIDNDGSSTSNNTSVIILDRPPYASFECSASVAHTEENLYFNASMSYDSDGTITSYFWEFGDQTNATGVAVSHQYSKCGNYTVTLTVKDDDESSNATSLNETIISWSTVASFTISPTHPSLSDSITFNASSSYDLGGTIERYRWNFGDGNTSETSTNTIAHSYSAPGEFNVTLTIFSTQGNNVSTTRQISLQIHDVAIIDLSLSATEIQIGQTVNITVKTRNKGTVPESFDITLFCNETMIASQHVADLSPDDEQDLVFYWNTSNIQDGGKFLIQAKADNVTGETALSDNSGFGGLVSVFQAQNNGSSSTSGVDWKWVLLIAPAAVLLSVALMWRRRNALGKFIGFEYFNEITNGGIPDSFSVLVTGGPGSGKSVLCQELAHTFLTQKRSCLYVTYDCFPDEVRDNLRKFHNDLSTHEAEKRLSFIDCFSAASKNKDRDYYLGQSFSLSDLGIVLSEATSDLGPSSKVVLDSINPLITHTEPLKVVEFLQDRGARIKGVNGTFIFTMGKATIEPSLTNRLEETVDCIVELDESTNKGKTVRRLRVKKMRGKKTSDKWVQFEIDPAKGIVFPT